MIMHASVSMHASAETCHYQWLRVTQPTEAVGAWNMLRACSAEARCWLRSSDRALNSSWYVVSYTGTQLTAFLPKGMVVLMPAALLVSFSLWHDMFTDCTSAHITVDEQSTLYRRAVMV